MERLKQVQESLNNIPAQLVGVGAAGSLWVERVDLYFKVISAVYISLLVIIMTIKLYKSVRDHFNGNST